MPCGLSSAWAAPLDDLSSKAAAELLAFAAAATCALACITASASACRLVVTSAFRFHSVSVLALHSRCTASYDSCSASRGGGVCVRACVCVRVCVRVCVCVRTCVCVHTSLSLSPSLCVRALLQTCAVATSLRCSAAVESAVRNSSARPPSAHLWHQTMGREPGIMCVWGGTCARGNMRVFGRGRVMRERRDTHRHTQTHTQTHTHVHACRFGSFHHHHHALLVLRGVCRLDRLQRLRAAVEQRNESTNVLRRERKACSQTQRTCKAANIHPDTGKRAHTHTHTHTHTQTHMTS